ncbi:putative immunoglobulin-like domain containing protein [Namao virus]|nr:putative immunoglobulin-like domain containing protein [Namao virus]
MLTTFACIVSLCSINVNVNQSMIGQPKELCCDSSSAASDNTQISWFLNNVSIINSTADNTGLGDSKPRYFVYTKGGGRICVLIKKVQANNTGLYTCTVDQKCTKNISTTVVPTTTTKLTTPDKISTTDFETPTPTMISIKLVSTVGFQWYMILYNQYAYACVFVIIILLLLIVAINILCRYKHKVPLCRVKLWNRCLEVCQSKTQSDMIRLI